MTEATIAISATFTAEPVATSLDSLLRGLGHSACIRFAPYGQLFRSLVDPKSVLAGGEPGLNVLLIRLEDWCQETVDRLPERATEFCEAISALATRTSRPLLVCFCPTAPDSRSLLEATTEVEGRLHDQLNCETGVYVVSSDVLRQTYPVAETFDGITNRTAHIPYTQAFFAALGTMIARRYDGLKRKPSKVLVLDCDNTLWSGVCGELGPRGVQVEDGHRVLQHHLIRLRDQGMLLALCSKNNEQDVWDVFEQNEGMLLRREHLAAAQINWSVKSQNLQRIADELQLGTDSFIFLDDNPMEIAEVRAHCPSVIAVQVPTTDRIPDFLNHLWPLDRLEVTEADRTRAEDYRVETQRRASRQRHTSLRQFVADLNLKLDFVNVDATNIERVSQLTQRTNQFNVSLNRLSSSELTHLLRDPDRIGIAVQVADKFGDYGLVGCLLCSRNSRRLLVDSFLLSCRALGRGVERHMLRHLGLLAEQEEADEIVIPFVRGERNQPAESFLNSIGEGKVLDDGVEYRFTKEVIAQIDPLAAEEKVEEKDAEPSVTSPTLPAGRSEVAPVNSQFLDWISKDLQTVEQVLNRLSTEARPRPDLGHAFVAPVNELEERVAEICEQILRFEKVGSDDSIKDLGGGSLELVQIHSQLAQQFATDLTITELYTLPTIRAIAERLSKTNRHHHLREAARPLDSSMKVAATSHDIAIIGMAGRFPGAESVQQFWENLTLGVNSIIDIPDSELNLALDDPLRSNPNFVGKSAALLDVDQFDAQFFGILPKEAQLMDPQHRIMVECCWHAMEDAGYCPDSVDVPVGVFAGCYMNTYILTSLVNNPALLASLADSFHGGDLLTELGNDNNYLATRISYLLNLRGPSLTIQTACSTSLVAIIQACQSLQVGQCDLAIAGGSTLKLPHNRGYLYTDGGMVSPDGVCRPFDADARGTVFGEGVGAVLLKRAEDAIADGDDIFAVIKGWGINNDGHSKMGYTAPSVDGQSAAISMAHRHAGVSADSITYVEAHGTGTSLGDPIEVDSLTKAFRRSTDKKQFCAIGSVKSNIGHLDVAAGVTGLIKNSLALRNRLIPPSLNYQRPNPNIDFANSPFYVVDRPQSWTSTTPRRAGLSSFGVGGTNAHVVMEEAPPKPPAEPIHRPQLIALSARSANSLDTATSDLARHLQSNPKLSLADVAHTLQVGRKAFEHTRVFLARDLDDAIESLCNPAASGVFSHQQARRGLPVAFLFPGQGSQHWNMARELHETSSIFRSHFDQCCDELRNHLGLDLQQIIYSKSKEQATEALRQTSIAQPAIFSVSYSLAKNLMELGVVPECMIGHSLGEFVAACLAGVFTLPDALRVIAFRAQQMRAMPTGAMLAVRAPQQELGDLIENVDVEIAVINGPSQCVVSGTHEAIESLREKLEAEQITCRDLQTSHAFHSAMMDPVVAPLRELLGTITLKEPTIAIVSSATGKPLTADEATDPGYWAQHLRRTVRFADAVGHLLGNSHATLVEVGPGQTLATLARQHHARSSDQAILSTMPHANDTDSSADHFLLTLGRLWQAGAKIDWPTTQDGQRRFRVHLPGYPFERQRYWLPESNVPPRVVCSPTETSGLPPRTASSPQTTWPRNPEERVSIDRLSASREEAANFHLAELLMETAGLELAGLDQRACFAELGLDSLFLVQLSQKITHRLQVKVTFRQLQEEITSLRSLAEVVAMKLPEDQIARLTEIRDRRRHLSNDLDPTAAGTAIASEDAATDSFSTIQEIQEHGHNPPLFCVHAADGFTRIYHALADALGKEQPVLGLNSPAVFGMPLPDDVRALAAQRVRDIQRIQPRGPYLLAGYCLGGTIALEIAQQLIAAGERVAFLGMIETYNWRSAPSTNPSVTTKIDYAFQRVEFHLLNFLQLNVGDKHRFLKAKFDVARARLRVWRDTIANRFAKESKRKPDSPGNMAEIWQKHDTLAQQYEAKPYPERMTHFRPRRDYRCHMGDDFVAEGGYELHRLDAYPAGTIVDPFVCQLAHEMRRCISRGLREIADSECDQRDVVPNGESSWNPGVPVG